jgi:[ribosomal protein S5]-alanine N-acetyltransferase
MVIFFSISDIVPVETSRLILRKFVPGDAPDVFRWASDRDIARYEPWEPLETLADAEASVRASITKYNMNNEFDLAIQLKSTGQVIGIIGISHIDRQHGWCEAGYTIGRKYWNHGYASEALQGFIQFAFRDLGMFRIEAVCMINNRASERVMRKANMQYEGIKHGRYFANGEYHSSKMYYILRSYS